MPIQQAISDDMLKPAKRTNTAKTQGNHGVLANGLPGIIIRTNPMISWRNGRTVPRTTPVCKNDEFGQCGCLYHLKRRTGVVVKIARSVSEEYRAKIDTIVSAQVPR
jgi:hypothetical protein